MEKKQYERPADKTMKARLKVITKENKDKDHYQVLQIQIKAPNNTYLTIHEMYLKDSINDIITFIDNLPEPTV